jgi:bacterioferritin
MDKKKIIEMLNADIEGEHAAIIQYLSHAYAMGEGEISCEIEAIAREEMRHLDFLAETIVELGGTPTLNRGEMRMWGRLVPDWMNNDILQEDDAIKLYKEHIKAIDDPKIKRLLERILSDEESHRGSFTHFVEKSRREKATDHRGDKQDETTRVLNWGIEHEYTVILQYMLQSYLTPNAEVSRELEDQAINEMQHLGWLAEELVDEGGRPRIEHTEVDQSPKTADMLRADIKIENEVAEAYDKAAQKIEDPGLKTLLIRIRDHEIYHTKVFGDLLKEEGK